MQSIAGEIQIVIAATLFLLLITFFIAFFIFYHQNQYHKYLKEKEEIKNTYKQEILKAQLEVKEQTLHTLSQEIHDNIGQVLSLAKLNLSTIQYQHASGIQEKIENTKSLVSKSIQDLRNLSKSMNSEYILNQPLSHSLEKELEVINKTGVYRTELNIQGELQEIDNQKKLILFRISQEILNNIIKHASASSISINFIYSEKELILCFQDDGIGFNFSQAMHNAGTGLGNIIHRTKLIGALINFATPENKNGTLISITLPYI